jgi:nitric oxide reductase NorD protein
MELDQLLFQRVIRYFRNRRKEAPELISRKVLLEDIRPRLTILARALTGDSIELLRAEEEGGYKYEQFYLPEEMAFLAHWEENLQFYIYRIFYLSIQRELGINGNSELGENLEYSRTASFEKSTDVLARMKLDYPGVAQLHDQIEQGLIAYRISLNEPEKFHHLHWMYGKLMPENDSERSKLSDTDDTLFEKNTVEATTEIKSKAVEEIKTLEVDYKAQEDYTLTHNFEKVETAEEFSGTWRDFDGDDSLEEDQEALDEINMKEVIRVDDMVHSVYQAEFADNMTIAESSDAEAKGHFIAYDEWSFQHKGYKKDHCKVFPKQVMAQHSDYYSDTIAKNATTLTGLRKMIANIHNKLEQQHRQSQGEEFDLDAVTDLFSEIQSGHSPSEKIYLSKRKKQKDLSITLLLDISLSSDSYTDGNKVLDVEKESAILFGEILNEFNIDFQVAGFFSKTRNFCTYIMLKDFDEPWSVGKHKIGAARAAGYTRIGPALRHAGALLEKRDSTNKWLLIMSDGKPNDYDKYEGKYGVADVKQALRELNQKHVNTYALAIENQAKYYLPQMFGVKHYQVLSSPAALIQALVLLFEKIRQAA